MDENGEASSPVYDRDWFVLYCTSGEEFAIKRKLNELKIENYLPYYEEVKKTSQKGRQRSYSIPLFSRYMFAKLSDLEISKANDIVGVSRILGSGGSPSSIAQNEIERMRRVAPDGLFEVGRKKRRRSRYKKGDLVRVADRESVFLGQVFTYESGYGIMRLVSDSGLTISIPEAFCAPSKKNDKGA